MMRCIRNNRILKCFKEYSWTFFARRELHLKNLAILDPWTLSTTATHEVQVITHIFPHVHDTSMANSRACGGQSRRDDVSKLDR